MTLVFPVNQCMGHAPRVVVSGRTRIEYHADLYVA